MKPLPKNYVFALSVRWGAWLLVVALLTGSGAFARLASNGWPLIALMYATMYTILWTRVLRKILVRTNDGSVIILYDLVLTALPVLLDGGWGSFFVLLPLSVLILPAISRGWRASLPVAASFLAIDQAVLWATTPNPWQISAQGTWASIMLLGRTLLPFGVVVGVAGVAQILRWARVRRRRATKPPAMQWEYPSVQSLLDSADIRAGAAYGRIAADEAPMRAWGKERASQPTLERRRPASIKMALQHLVPDLEAAGIAVTVHTEGEEQRLPPRIHELLTRATEVALDNVIAHAHARSVVINVQITHEDASLVVCDDGIGLFDGTAEPPGFHQIKRLRFRTQELGGTLQIEDREEGGVGLRLQVPLGPA